MDKADLLLDNLSDDEQHDLSNLLDQFIQRYENEYDEKRENVNFLVII